MELLDPADGWRQAALSQRNGMARAGVKAISPSPPVHGSPSWPCRAVRGAFGRRRKVTSAVAKARGGCRKVTLLPCSGHRMPRGSGTGQRVPSLEDLFQVVEAAVRRAPGG